MINPEPARRPYAATANVLAVIERTRTRTMPPKIDPDFYAICGVPAVVTGRVAEALEFLGLVEADGVPTDVLQSMARAPEAEYRTMLDGTVRQAYNDDFARIDPAKDAQSQIIDAFRRYDPKSQTSRMVMLFLGLCRAAGIAVKDAPRERQMQQTARRGVAPPRVVKAPPGTVPRFEGGSSGAGSGTGSFFGLTEADMAHLNDDEFDAVWAALGKVAQAKFRAARPAATPGEPAPETGGIQEEIVEEGNA